ncbi:MAG: hypothetical protein KDB24_06360, partial [Microthrixaceae bacterium]|nr:hypothetical protein [Microthrixaceae bacterium]
MLHGRTRRAAGRTEAPAQTNVAPGWWVRQHDPASSLYLPTPLASRNRVEVGWSLVSTLDGAGAASVDRRGALMVPGATWLLDWWFNHDGTWQRAAEAASVRRHRGDGLPMSETRVRVGPNELIVRHGACPRRGAPGGAWVTIEVEVDGPDPVGLALVATPWTLGGPGRIDRVAVERGVLSVDGRTALVAQRPPRAVHLVEAADDLIAVLGAADGVSTSPATAGPSVADHVAHSAVDSSAGTAGAALVWPMAHRSSLRLGVPIGPDIEAGTDTLDLADAQAELERAPELESMAKGWDLHLGVGATLESPDESLTAMARAARAQLLAAADGRWFTGADASAAAVAAGALARLGHHEVVAEVVAEVARVVDDDPAGLSAVLEASVGLGVTRSAEDVAEAPDELLVHLARAVHVIHRRLKRHGAGWWPEDDRARLRSLVEVAGALADRWGQDGVSDNARSIAGMLPIGRQSGAGGDQVTPSADVVGDPGSPVPPDPAAAHDGEVRWVRRAPGADLDLPATLASARADIAAGRPAGATTVAAVADLLQRLECWPDVVHPTRPLGVGDHGASVATMGLLVAAALDLAAPLAGDSVSAFVAFPSAWWGRPAQFSDLPVADGTVSCALRWHGARPALIWELTPWASLGGRPAPAPLRAPAL